MMDAQNKPGNGRPLSVPSLITVDLGYCCVWVFFQKYKRTSLIARRLGVTSRTVRVWKAKALNGQLTCANCPSCLKDKIL